MSESVKMCSVDDDDFDNDGGLQCITLQKNVGVSSLPTKECNKCGRAEELYKLPCREAECRECFLVYVNHKFRATLGSSKVLPRKASILLLFDGSAESIVLLDMLQKAQLENTFKRLNCSSTVLFIDDSKLARGIIDAYEYGEYLKNVKEYILKYDNMKAYVTNLMCSKNQKPFDFKDLDLYMARNAIEEDVFAERYRSIRSSTSRQDFLKLHRKSLVAAVARYLNCGYIFVPVINLSLAGDLLSAVVLGRGGSAALDVAFLDDRLGNGIKLLRPLKDLNQSEVELYLRAQNLPILRPCYDSSLQADTASLQDITTSFVQNLQHNYASTVTTIFRTGSKIMPNRNSGMLEKADDIHKIGAPIVTNNISLCKFCKSSLDCDTSSTLSAVQYSRYVSEAAVISQNLPDLNGTLPTTGRQGLCHGCKNIQRECDIDLINLENH